MKNTNDDFRSHSQLPSASGESGENCAEIQLRTAGSGDPEPPHVVDAMKDQRGQHWLKIQFQVTHVWAKIEDLLGNARALQERFSAKGVLFPDVIARQFTKSIEPPRYRDGHAAYQPGWAGVHYVMGNGKIISPSGVSLDIPIVFSPWSKFTSRGTTEQWNSAITPLVKDQHFPLFAISIPFLPPLLDILHEHGVDAQNPIFEIVHRSTRAKTTVAIKLAGSAIGFTNRHTGFGESWYTTKEGVVALMDCHNDCFLGMDETNLASDEQVEMGRLVKSAVHIIANGTDKTTKLSGVSTHSYRLVLMSTSNVSLAKMLSSEGTLSDHLAARLISIVPPRSTLGVLSFIPKQFSSSAVFVGEMRRVASTFYGAPFFDFMQRLVEERKSQPGQLVGTILAAFNKFMRAIKVNNTEPLQYRRAAPFAAAYAASVLARNWGILPKKSTVGDYLAAFKTVWSWATIDGGSSKPLGNPRSRVTDYAEQFRSEFLQASPRKRMSNKQFNTLAGVVSSRSGKKELIMSRRQFDSYFAFKPSECAYLRKSGIIIAEPRRYTTKRTVRRNKNGDLVQNERVVVIDLTKV